MTLSKEEVLELTLLRDSLSQNLEHSHYIPDGDFMIMEDRDRLRWLAVVEKILEQLQ